MDAGRCIDVSELSTISCTSSFGGTIWAEKPSSISAGGLLGRALMGDDYWGLPLGSHGSAYLNFGWFGMIPFGVMSGIIIGLLYRLFLHSGKADKWNTVVVAVYPFIIIPAVNLFDGIEMLTIISILVSVTIAKFIADLLAYILLVTPPDRTFSTQKSFDRAIMSGSISVEFNRATSLINTKSADNS